MGQREPIPNPPYHHLQVMTTLHGSTPFSRRLVDSCVSPKGMITSVRDSLTHLICLIEPLWSCRLPQTQLRFHSYTWVHLWTFKAALVTIGFSYPFHNLFLLCSKIATCLSFIWATYLHRDQCISISSELPSCYFSCTLQECYLFWCGFDFLDQSQRQIDQGFRVIRYDSSACYSCHDFYSGCTVRFKPED